MVHHIGEKDFYRRGCNDGATLILSLVLLFCVITLTLINYLSPWPVFFPVLSLFVVILNMAGFASYPLYRFKNEKSVIFFIVVHAVCLVAGVIFLALLVAQTSLFLSPDCESCSLSWSDRNDVVCSRSMSECQGQGKYRFGVVVLFPTGASLFVMEMVNVVTALMALVFLMKEKKGK
jgi:hypothetical protein